MSESTWMDKYADMLGLAHHVSSVHPHLSRQQRAAQFAPFAALAGYAEGIKRVEGRGERRSEGRGLRVAGIMRNEE